MCRIVLGKDMRVKGLVGLSSIRSDAEERGDSAQDRWYEEAQIPDSEVTGAHAEHPRGQLLSSTECLLSSFLSTFGKHLALMYMYQTFAPHAGRLKYPLALAAASENVAFELAGWRTSTGILLRKPILASLQLTPDIARQAITCVAAMIFRKISSIWVTLLTRAAVNWCVSCAFPEVAHPSTETGGLQLLRDAPV